MIKLLLLIFSVVVFVLLAANWMIHADQVRWSYAALAAFIVTFIPFHDMAAPVYFRRTAPPA